ncbi:MAG: hypothetical protein HY870_16415, partial [Chloroflexi bacterium]|nr:hypothetical protein [Chloroflexota bacterium]
MFTRSLTRLGLALIIVIASLLFIASFTTAAVIARPRTDLIVNPGESIQAAINAATDGDTIIVNAGTYTESLTLSKPVSLTGVNSDTTILHAVAGQRVLTVTGATITNSVVISGLTFTGGSADYGGGMLITNTAQPNLQAVQFISNAAGISGGGVYVTAPLTLTNAVFTSNTAYIEGGGVYAEQALVVDNTTFVGNAATGVWPPVAAEGGGIYTLGDLTMINSNLSHNSSIMGGGAFAAGQVILTQTDFINNATRPGGDGGGLYALNGPVSLYGGRFISNTTTYGYGGGLDIFLGGDLVATGTQFIGNFAYFGGGGLFGYKMTLSDTLFERNVGQIDGGGAVWAYRSVEINNSQFVSNTGRGGGGIIEWSGAATISETSFRGNTSTDNQDGGGLLL